MKGKHNIFYTLKELGLDFKTEYKFLPNRKFRFDFAVPKDRVGIEYEGVFSNISRHTTASGYTGDTEKYNLAVLNGWRVLRYTALNYENLYKDIKQLLKIK